MEIVLIIIGLILLVVGAEFVVRGASRLAVLLGVPPIVIGLTIVSVGTSTPELAVGIISAQQDSGGLAVGNIAGTNLFNLLFILGLSAFIRPLPLHSQIFKLELPVVVIAATLMTLLAWDQILSPLDGGVMLLVGVVYTAVLLMIIRKAPPATKKEFQEEYGLQTVPQKQRKDGGKDGGRAWYATVLGSGIILTVIGGEFLVRGAVGLAQSLGVSETIIGLTVVAIGTSAPELVMTIISTLRNDRDVAVGNLLGSSIYNILVILSITCLVSPNGLPIEPQLLWIDIPLMALVALGAVPVFLTGRQVSRIEGGMSVAIYILYLLTIVTLRV